MSRAFVKESDGDAPDDGLPEKQESGQPNYVTEQGLADLKRQLDDAVAERKRLIANKEDLGSKAPLARLARDIRYLQRRIADAILVDTKADPDEVTLGAIVTIDDGEQRRTFTVVGEDQADPTQGLISWTSPLGQALMGAKRGASVVWQRPVGDVTVTIVDVQS
jgi:transcription elongation GreA/GreB family factor